MFLVPTLRYATQLSRISSTQRHPQPLHSINLRSSSQPTATTSIPSYTLPSPHLSLSWRWASGLHQSLQYFLDFTPWQTLQNPCLAVMKVLHRNTRTTLMNRTRTRLFSQDPTQIPVMMARKRDMKTGGSSHQRLLLFGQYTMELMRRALLKRDEDGRLWLLWEYLACSL